MLLLYTSMNNSGISKYAMLWANTIVDITAKLKTKNALLYRYYSCPICLYYIIIMHTQSTHTFCLKNLFFLKVNFTYFVSILLFTGEVIKCVYSHTLLELKIRRKLGWDWTKKNKHFYTYIQKSKQIPTPILVVKFGRKMPLVFKDLGIWKQECAHTWSVPSTTKMHYAIRQ